MKCILVLLLIFLLPHNIVQGKTWRIKERRKTVTLDEADRDCDANVGRLAVIRTAVDKDDVIDRLSEDGKNGGPYWIGIKRMKTTWIWYDGTEYDPSGNGFRFAKTVDDITSAECALIVFDDEDSEYEMVKVSCTTVAAMGWICEVRDSFKAERPSSTEGFEDTKRASTTDASNSSSTSSTLLIIILVSVVVLGFLLIIVSYIMYRRTKRLKRSRRSRSSRRSSRRSRKSHSPSAYTTSVLTFDKAKLSKAPDEERFLDTRSDEKPFPEMNTNEDEEEYENEEHQD